MEMSEFLIICNEKRDMEVSKRLSKKIETEKENRELIAKSYRTVARVLTDSIFWKNASVIISSPNPLNIALPTAPISDSRLILELTRNGFKLFEEAVGNIKPVVNLDRHWNIELAGCRLYNLTSRGICIETTDLEASVDDIIHKIAIECCEKAIDLLYA